MWNGFRKEEFEFEERMCTIVYPETQSNGKMLYKTEYLSAFPTFDIEMLKKGYHLIHLKNTSRWVIEEDIHRMARFVKHCAEKLQLSKKCILEGLSLGGLQATLFAQLYPDLTDVLYIDAPVLNIISMAGCGACKLIPLHWKEIVEAYNVNESTIVNFRKSPIDNMPPLIENNIPVVMLYGDKDDVVIYEENGKVLSDYYNENGGNIKLIKKEGCGHHPHGLENATPIIEFIERNFKP